MCLYLLECLQTSVTADCFRLILQQKHERLYLASAAAVLTLSSVVTVEIFQGAVMAGLAADFIQGHLTCVLSKTNKDGWLEAT